MDLPEGKLALREIKNLEDGMERRLREVRQRTKETIDRARAEADERIRLKEGELAQLRCRLEPEARGAERPEPPMPAEGFTPDKMVVAGLARDIFNVITGR